MIVRVGIITTRGRKDYWQVHLVLLLACYICASCTATRGQDVAQYLGVPFDPGNIIRWRLKSSTIFRSSLD